MKTFITLFSFAIALTALSPTAFAAPPGQSVNALRISGLGNHLGKNITAFYAIGRAGLLAAQKDQVVLRVVKWTKTLAITEDSVTFPATPVLSWSGNQMPYNIVVLAIHNEKEMVWVNADQTRPEGSGDGAFVQPLYVDTIKSTQINELKSEFGEGILNFQFSFGN